MTPRRLASVALRAHDDHVGVRCRAMAQTTASLASREHALLLECASLDARQIPFHARLFLVDTGVRHDLLAGRLNERRAACEAPVKRLKLELPELAWLASWPADCLPPLKPEMRSPLRRPPVPARSGHGG